MEHAVGETGKEFDESPQRHRSDAEQHDDAADAGMPQRIGVAFERITEDAPVSAMYRHFLGRHGDAGQGDDEGDIGQSVQGEGERDAALRDDKARGGRTEKARAVEHQRIDRHRRAERGAIDQAGDQCQTRRLIGGVGDAEAQRQQEQHLDVDDARKGEEGEQHGLDHGGNLGCPDQADAVDAVSERAGERADHHHRYEIGGGAQSQPGARMGQLPGEPADGDALHPGAGKRNQIADGVDAVVADAQRVRHVFEARNASRHSQNHGRQAPA